MNPGDAATAFPKPVTLRDGTAVTIRPARPDDKPRLVAAFDALERESVYTRFFGFRKGLSASELATVEANDFVRRAHLVATLARDGDEIIVGSASYVVEPDAPVRSAEAAFTVEEDHQGQGLAGTLLRLLVGIARAQGLQRLTAEVLAGNAPMLAVFGRCGLPMRTRSSGGVVRLEVDLTASPT